MVLYHSPASLSCWITRPISVSMAATGRMSGTHLDATTEGGKLTLNHRGVDLHDPCLSLSVLGRKLRPRLCPVDGLHRVRDGVRGNEPLRLERREARQTERFRTSVVAASVFCCDRGVRLDRPCLVWFRLRITGVVEGGDAYSEELYRAGRRKRASSRLAPKGIPSCDP